MIKIKYLPLFIISLLSMYFIYGVILQFDDFSKITNGEEISIENPSLFFSGLIAGILAIYLIVIYFKKRNKIRRTISSKNQVAIRDFANGEVAKVVGKVMPVTTPLIAPLTGKKCVFYHAIIEEMNETEVNAVSLTYHPIIDEKEYCDFTITDGTGSAEIKPENAIVSIKKDYKKGTGFFKEMDERMKNFLKKHNLDSSKFLGTNPPYRFQEGTIEVNEKVAVFGEGKRNENSNSLTLAHSNQHSLYLSDEPETF